MYQTLGYIELVERAAEQSMRASVEEVQSLPEYSTKGEVCGDVKIIIVVYQVSLHCKL